MGYMVKIDNFGGHFGIQDGGHQVAPIFGVHFFK